MQPGRMNRPPVKVGPMLKKKRSRQRHWRDLPTADAVVTDQCVLWRQFVVPHSLFDDDEVETGDRMANGSVAHFEVEFTDGRGRLVRCWTDNTLYLCSQVRRGDHVTVWYVPDDDVSLIRVPRMRARGDEGGESPYAKRRTVQSMGKSEALRKSENLPPMRVLDGSDDEAWCEPGTFGDAMAHSEWGREYWRCMPAMWYSPWVFGDASAPERYTWSDVRYFKSANRELRRSVAKLIALLVGCSLVPFWFLLAPDTSDFHPWDYIFIVVGVVVTVLYLCYVVAIRRDDRRTMRAVLSRGHILRWYPPRASEYPREAGARVAEVIRVPLFANGGEVPVFTGMYRDYNDMYDRPCLRYCGDGWMALVVYTGIHAGERRWAFADPECYESYLADGEEPPVRPGDEVVVRLGREEAERNINPWLVHSLRA